jgi:hypothetical protein
MKKFDFEFLLIIIVVIITSVLAVNRSNSSNLSSSSNRLNIEKVSGQTPQARGHEPWYVDGYVLSFILLLIFFLMSIT